MKKTRKYKPCPHCGNMMYRRFERWVCSNGYSCAHTERITPKSEDRGNGN